MTNTSRRLVRKTASEMQPKDRFYLSGQKYCVISKPVKDMFGRVIITFIHTNHIPPEFSDLSVAEDFPFMVLTGESGISEKAYDELEKMRKNDKAEVQTISPEKRRVLDIFLKSRAEADAVLDHLFQMLVKYDVASVADLYDAVGLTGTYEDTKWGWATLAGSDVKYYKGIYQVILPEPVQIVKENQS